MPPPRFRSLRIEMIIAGFTCLLWPSTAWANPIVHPIAFVWPAAWILLVPVVLIEAAVAVRVLKLSIRASLWLSLWANLLSTALGVPIGTCLNPIPLIFLLEFGTKSAAGIWLFLASLLLTLYLLSVVAEAWVARRLVDESRRQKAWRWAWLANLVTYALISAGLIALALIDWLHRRLVTA